MKIINDTVAKDFNAVTSERTPFILSRLQGSKILLSFYRNGACPLSNYRLQQLKEYRNEFIDANMQVVSVFESMPRDIFPFSGRTEHPFFILADPMALLYDMYHVETSEEKLKNILIDGTYSKAVANAERKGFLSVPQEGSNFFRQPADFLIDENFVIRKAHYTNQLNDFLSMGEIMEWANGGDIMQEKNEVSQLKRKIA